MTSDAGTWLKKYAALAIDQRPAAIAIIDPNGVVRFTNQNFQIILGYSSKNIVGKHIHTVLCTSSGGKSDHNEQQCSFLFSIHKGMPQSRKVSSVYDSNTVVRWYEVSTYPLNRRGSIEAAVVAFTHISTSLRNATELELNLAKVKAFFNTGDYGKIIIDADLYVVAANHFVHSLSVKSTLIGYKITNIVPPKFRFRFNTFITKAIRYPEKKPHIFSHRNAEGETVYWEFDIEANFIPDNHAVFFKDVSREQKEVRRREQFLGFVGHELRNPLAVVKAYTQLLQRRLKGIVPDKYVTYLSKIYSQSNVLERLIEDIVDEYRIGAKKLNLDLVPLQLDNFLMDVVENFKKTQPKRKIVITQRQSVMVQADLNRLTQVILNLLNNAHKYSSIDLPIEIDLGKKSRNAILAITNFGKGIRKEDKYQIFEPFFRSKDAEVEKRAGLGLGLYVSKHIIKLHHGKIWFTSSASKTTFTLSLPLSTTK